ncbi:MAG: hypothetical protein ACO3SD_05945 [Gemmatimonadaceae bacterium]
MTTPSLPSVTVRRTAQTIAALAAVGLMATSPRLLEAQPIRTSPPPARATQPPVAGALGALGSPPNP